MCRNGSACPIVVLVILVVATFVLPPNNASAAAPSQESTSPPSILNVKNITVPSILLLNSTLPNNGSSFNGSILPQCSINETLYNCTLQDKCCQSQGDILVEQLKEIKERFQGVDSTIRKDYGNIKGIAKEGLERAKASLLEVLSSEHSILFPSFNKSMHILYQILIGYGKSDDLITTTRSLPVQILHQMLITSNVSRKQFPRTIKGISIFWDLSTDQRSCVANYMIQSTDFGDFVDALPVSTWNSTQSMHQYMSLLGSMVRIIKNVVDSQQTDQCIEKIVKMQQCSICTNTSVCPTFYNKLLSGCIPQVEELYQRWDPLMTAMSQLTLRLCESDLMSAYSGLLRLAEFVTAGKLNDLIYQHGVLAYMKCVQTDSRKRSSSRSAGRSEESMQPEEELVGVPSELLNSYVYTPSNANLIDDITLRLLRKREVTQPPSSAYSTEPVDHLFVCREKLGLSFPPLELGSSTSLLNVSISRFDTDCWNGLSVGSYAVNKTSTTMKVPRPEALAIKELDEKMCQYTTECAVAEEVRVPYKNSHHGPSVIRVLASLVPSLYYCCC